MAAVLSVILACPVAALAQSRQAIHGFVHDRFRKPVSAAEVVLESRANHEKIVATTGEHGEFEAVLSDVGAYSVLVEASGYLRLDQDFVIRANSAAGYNLQAELWPTSAEDAKHPQMSSGALVLRRTNPRQLLSGTEKPAHPAAIGTAISKANASPGVNSPADFSLYSQVIASDPQPFGFNVSQSAGSNLTDNAILQDGGFAPYDVRLALTASDDGTATTFISTNAHGGGGTDDYSSIASGYFVGAEAHVYRFENNKWKVIRRGHVTGYTAVSSSNAPEDHTITFADEGTPTKAGDVVWLSLQDVHDVPSPNLYDPRFAQICLNWNNDQTGCWQKNAPAPYTYDTSVPPGETASRSLMLTDANTETNGISQYIYIGIDTYESFLPGHTYRADVWLKESAGTDGTATFSIAGVSHTFTGLGTEWKHVTWDFPAPSSLSGNDPEPKAGISFNAPGTLWVNHFQVYDASFPPFTLNPQVKQAWTDFHPGTMRIWSGFDDNGNYAYWSLAEWIGAEKLARDNPGIGNQYEGSANLELLPTALAYAKELGAKPWLMLNMSYDDVEIANLIEYLEAPAGVGFAVHRPANHPGPYTDDFENIYLEVGNEEWGTQVTPVNFAYGQWAQFWIDSAKKLANYDPKGSKIQWIVNGFFLQPSFGSAAIAQAPDAKWVDYAIYSGGDDSLTGDPYYQSDLLTLVSSNKGLIDNMVAQQQVDALNGHKYRLTAYESGPGDDTPVHQGDTSLAAAVGSLDVELYAALRGFGPENYFLYNLGSGPYTSHSDFKYGLLPHPAWEAFQMRNRYCHGPMTWTIPNSVPVTNDSNQYPLIGVYTFHDTNAGKNDAQVVVISRDLNNTTPVTLHFPFTPTGTATLHTLTGDPRGNNDTALAIPIATQTLTGITANYTFNMPPGSVYILDVPATSAWTNNTPVPATPANLQATADNGKVSLLWGTVDGATSYDLKRSTTSGGPYTSIAKPTGAGFTDTNLVNGTTYYYVVAAVNIGGESPNSTEASAEPNVEDVAFTSVAPTIDGSDDGPWANVVAKPLAHDFNTYTPDTATFKALWDNNYLYVLAAVQDATPTTSDTPYEGDSVEVYFSGTDSKASSYGPTDFQYVFLYGGTTPVEYGHGATAGVLYGQKVVPGGYQMTIAIPWTTLGTTPKAGTQYGFDVMVDDAISNDDRIGKLAWWATEDLSYAYPYLFGPAVLTK
jgi:hypothetical protein